MEELPINITDAGILVVLLISALFGFARGFVKEVLSITGWIGATFITLYLFPIAQPYTQIYIPNLLLADILTGSVIFILCLVILSYITHGISAKVKASALGALDRTLGIFFGLARTFVLVGIAWIFFVQFLPPEDRPQTINQARMLPLIVASGKFVAALTPVDMQKNLQIAKKSAEGSGSALKKGYESIPEAVRDDVEKTVKDALENLDKGYDSKSRKQMENLTKGTQVKP